MDQKDKGIIGQSILVVDNGYSWVGYLNSSIQIIRSYFPEAEISLLILPERKSELEKDFPVVRFILPAEGLRPKKYRLALQMLKMRREKHDFIVLFSLDITPVTVALMFFKAKVVLYNQWEQWWSLRMRRFGELFKITYTKKKVNFSFKALLKKAGLFFVLLQRQDEEVLKHSVLIVDNGYVGLEHISDCIQEIKEVLPQANLSLLVLKERAGLGDELSEIQIIQASKCVIKRYRLLRHMLRLRKNRYDYIILLSLDITPIIASMLFMRGKVILFNRWYQWWVLGPRSVHGYLKVVPNFIFGLLIFVYLLISVLWIFLKMSFNAIRFAILGKRV